MAAPTAVGGVWGVCVRLRSGLGCAVDIDPNERQVEGCPPELLFVMLEQFRTG